MYFLAENGVFTLVPAGDEQEVSWSDPNRSAAIKEMEVKRANMGCDLGLNFCKGHQELCQVRSKVREVLETLGV